MITLHVFFVLCTRCNIDITVLLVTGGFTQCLIFLVFGSFGRAGSGEDVSDTGREQDGDIQSPAEYWTAKIQRVQPGMELLW